MFVGTCSEKSKHCHHKNVITLLHFGNDQGQWGPEAYSLQPVHGLQRIPADLSAHKVGSLIFRHLAFTVPYLLLF